jgi:aromatic ring-opening dioxygenase catalytic subunit (LigB family)
MTLKWTERTPTISNAGKHELYFDYGGFPKEAYEFRYPAPGSPEIARGVHDLLSKAGFKPEMDSIRGRFGLNGQFQINETRLITT